MLALSHSIKNVQETIATAYHYTIEQLYAPCTFNGAAMSCSYTLRLGCDFELASFLYT